MVDMPQWISAPLYVSLVAFSCWMIASSFAYFIFSYLSRSWYEVTASIHKVRTFKAPLAKPIEGIQPAQDRYRKLKVEYEYTMQGRRYSGGIVTIRDLVGLPMGGHSDELFRHVKLAFGSGAARISVYVSKRRPVLSVMFRDDTHWFSIATGLFGCLFLAFCIKTWEFESMLPLLIAAVLTSLAYFTFVLGRLRGGGRRIS